LVLSPVLSRAAEEFASTSLAEMSSGKTKVFKSETIQKSFVNFEISHPASWQVAESPRPSVIVLIGDTNHAAVANFVITENRIPKATDSSPDHVFTKSFFTNFKPANTVMLRGERHKEGTFDGALLEYITTQSRGELHFRIYGTNYTFAKNGALVQLQFYVFLGENEDKKADEAKVAAFKPLWKSMVATLKIQP